MTKKYLSTGHSYNTSQIYALYPKKKMWKIETFNIQKYVLVWNQRYISSKLLSVCNDFEQMSWISMNYFILRVRALPGLCCNVLYSLEPLMFTLNLNLFCVLRLFHWAPPFMDCIGYFIGHQHLWIL